MSASIWNPGGSFVATAKVFYVDSYGAIGGGLVDDTTKIQETLDLAGTFALGGIVVLSPSKKYRITHKLNVPDNVWLWGQKSQLVGSYLDFNYQPSLGSGGRYGDAAGFVDLSGLTEAPYTSAVNRGCVGVAMLFETPADILTGGTKRTVNGIIARNVINPQIVHCEMQGFMTGAGIRAASLRGGAIQSNYLHDFFDNNSWTGTPADAQISGIELDNDRVNGVGCADTQISSNYIANMICGAQSISTAGGYQSDGINIAGIGGDHAHDLVVANNRIRKCAEGIDAFSRNCTFVGNIINETYIFGMKFIHGAQYNSVQGGSITNCGLAGITMQGSGAVGASDTKGNSVTGTVISTVDYLGTWSASSSAGILFADNGGSTGKPRENTITGVVINEGANGKYGWLDSSSGANNVGEGIRVTTGAANSRRVLVTTSGGTCRVAGSGTYSTDLV